MTGPVSAASYLRKAERALDEAQLLLREAATEGACNRAFYAMHDAAHAALHAGGYETAHSIIKTHHGLIAEFGGQIVPKRQARRCARPRSQPGCRPFVSPPIIPVSRRCWTTLKLRCEKAGAFVAAVRALIGAAAD